MKKLMALALFAMVFSAPMAMAQGTGGMMNTPSSELPTLTGPQSDNFSAASMSDAQNICDQVASANNKSSCVAHKNEAAPENAVTYHCECP